MDFDELDTHAEEENRRREAVQQQDARWQAFVHRREEQARRRRQQAEPTEQDRRWQLKEHELIKKRDELFLGSKAEEGMRHVKDIVKKLHLERGDLAEYPSSEGEEQGTEEPGKESETEEDAEEEETEVQPKCEALLQESPEDCRIPAGPIVEYIPDRAADARAAMQRRQEERRRRRHETAERIDEEKEEELPPDAFTAKLWKMMASTQHNSRRGRTTRGDDLDDDERGEAGEESGDNDFAALQDCPDPDDVPDLLQILQMVDREDKEEEELEAVQAFLPDLETQANLRGEPEDEPAHLERALQVYKDKCPDIDLKAVIETHAEGAQLAVPFEESEGRTEMLLRKRQEMHAKRAAKTASFAEARTKRFVQQGGRPGVGLPPAHQSVEGLWVQDWPMGSLFAASSSSSSTPHWQGW